MQQVALVTGATEGIGRAIAFALGGEGYRLGVCARSPDRVRTLVADLDARGIQAAGIPADVGDEDQVRILVRYVTDTIGPIHTLVNNAGVLIFKPVEQLELADWDLTLATNLRGMFLTTRAVVPGMRARRSGAIVNIASLAGRNGIAGGTAYCASKHGVLGFSRALMQEVRADGIRVICICPGSVDTGMIRSHRTKPPAPDSLLAPEDVADAVLAALRLPGRALMSEVDLRPSHPR